MPLLLPDQTVHSRSDCEPYQAVGVATVCYPNRVFNATDYDAANPTHAYYKFLRAVYRLSAVDAWRRAKETR